MSDAFAFLSARWTNLALLTYSVDPEILKPLVPPNCALDTIEGSAFVSLVAFDFLDTRVLGIPWPGFRNFPEINLRFYVRQGDRRGVCFLREFVPQRLVAWMARAIYNEPYLAVPMSSRVERTGETIAIEHRLTFAGRENRLRVVADLSPCEVTNDCPEHFFKEHEWGFGQTRRGKLLRYRVEHPIWRIHKVRSHELDWDWAGVYGAGWEFLKGREPASVILAEGSTVRVFPKGTV